MRSAHILVLLPALVGVALGAYAYVTPETGVEGTGGALLALIGAVAVSLGALFALRGSSRVLNVLMGLGAALTAVAAWFLMQYPFAAAMALAFLGLVAAATRHTRERTG